MRARIGRSVGFSLGLLCAVFFAAQAEAGEDYDAVSCSGWMNCSTESPNYTGFCCRTCQDKTNKTIWDCRRVGGETEQLAAAPAAKPPTGAATITGIVTRKGVLQTEEGQDYTVAGTKATELRDNMGKQIEVKGTVQEADGKTTVDVDTYQMMGFEPVAPVETGGSCGGWLNCDSRPPTFTGTCCRRCPDEKGQKFWDCKVFSVGEHFDLAEWSQLPR